MQWSNSRFSGVLFAVHWYETSHTVYLFTPGLSYPNILIAADITSLESKHDQLSRSFLKISISQFLAPGQTFSFSPSRPLWLSIVLAVYMNTTWDLATRNTGEDCKAQHCSANVLRTCSTQCWSLPRCIAVACALPGIKTSTVVTDATWRPQLGLGRYEFCRSYCRVRLWLPTSDFFWKPQCRPVQSAA